MNRSHAGDWALHNTLRCNAFGGGCPNLLAETALGMGAAENGKKGPGSCAKARGMQGTETGVAMRYTNKHNGVRLAILAAAVQHHLSAARSWNGRRALGAAVCREISRRETVQC